VTLSKTPEARKKHKMIAGKLLEHSVGTAVLAY
jgi:hypothetical protein